MKEYLLKIINYNHWSTEALLEIIEKNKIQDEYILKMLSHYLNVFYSRFNDISPRKQTLPNLWDVHSFETLKSMNDEISELIVSYLLHIKPRETLEKIHTKSTDGEEINVSKGDMLIHIVNHAAHHRGQICKRLSELGYKSPGIGYLRYAHSLPDFW
jgi:uncharacterized damage-inducible protein DinB